MSPHGATSPEQAARKKIDAAFTQADWVVQDRATMNLTAGRPIGQNR